MKPGILRDDVMHHLSVNIGEPEIATVRAISEFLVIEVEQLLRVEASRQVDEAAGEVNYLANPKLHPQSFEEIKMNKRSPF